MNWELAKRSTKCAGCQKSFDLGETYKTALHTKTALKEVPVLSVKGPFDETGSRLDYCPECWERMSVENAHDFSWKGRIAEEGKEPKLTSPALNRAELLILLREHLEASQNFSDEDQRVWKNGVAYFLALLMERKRWLANTGDRQDESSGANCAVYEDPKSKETFVIKYPLLNDLKAYQEEISRLLNIPLASVSA